MKKFTVTFKSEGESTIREMISADYCLLRNDNTQYIFITGSEINYREIAWVPKENVLHIFECYEKDF